MNSHEDTMRMRSGRLVEVLSFLERMTRGARTLRFSLGRARVYAPKGSFGSSARSN